MADFFAMILVWKRDMSVISRLEDFLVQSQARVKARLAQAGPHRALRALMGRLSEAFGASR